jgi:hemerythrin superfamily protein
MAQDTILNLMVNHHALIETMFVSFRDEAREKFPRAGASLSELSWEMKKHFFAEENAIFDFFPLKSMDIFRIINQLKEEHISMLNYLKKFSDNLARISEEDIEDFYKLLKDHRETEEKKLYPKLDKEMREDQKMQILSRINEIPITRNIK